MDIRRLAFNYPGMVKIGMRCLNCGFPIDRRNLPAMYPKCDEDLIQAKARKPLVVDLAHGGETVSQALAKLDKAVSECLWHGHPS